MPEADEADADADADADVDADADTDAEPEAVVLVQPPKNAEPTTKPAAVAETFTKRLRVISLPISFPFPQGKTLIAILLLHAVDLLSSFRSTVPFSLQEQIMSYSMNTSLQMRKARRQCGGNQNAKRIGFGNEREKTAIIV